MSMQSIRKLAATAGMAAMLFTQLALAAYVCPALAGIFGDMPAVVADDMRSAMPDCGELDTDNPNLCLQHCQSDSLSVQTLPWSMPAAADVLLTVIVLLQPDFSPGMPLQSVPPQQATSPPPLVRFGVLRI